MQADDLTRRHALQRLAALALGSAALTACPSDDDDSAAPDDDDVVDDDDAMDDDDVVIDCVVIPEQTAGPFYFDAGQVRTNIDEGLPGQAIAYALTVLDGETCEPIPDAVVDLWHADAAGRYSGYPGQGDDGDVDTSGEDFLRGVQVTDADGRVTFNSIFPGWYPGRTAHVHLKIHLDQGNVATSQFYFPQFLNDEIYGYSPYSDRTTVPVSNLADAIYNQVDTDAVLCRIDDENGLVAHLTIGVHVA